MARNNNAKRQHTLQRRKRIAAAMRALWARRKAEGYQPSMNGVIAMHKALERESEADVEAQLQRIEAQAKARRRGLAA